MGSDPAVATAGLTVRYGERAALDGVDLTVEAGEWFGVLGPNGGGKTTLFSVLSTALAPSSGAASVFGRDVAAEPRAVRRRIGVVFQAPALDRKLTVRENLTHHGHLHGLCGGALRERMAGALGGMGVSARAGDRVESLSGGLARRVEIAKCLVHAPDLLILDEPTTGLDPGARADLWAALASLRASRGTTVLVTTHWMEDAERCGRLAILDRGRVVASGTPSGLRAGLPFGVVTFRTGDPARLASLLTERLGAAAAAGAGEVRVETRDGHDLARRASDSFPDLVDAVTVGRPTLEDVFLHRTGRRFSGGAES